ncbi:hypothetical protein RTM1035_17770 [Roseovarius sp. TM1035]|nr:hypothetical protein RTM1035_17770 [Roseovarius sp. TM1035]
MRRTTPTKGTHFHHFQRPLNLGFAVGLADFAHLKRKAEVFGNRHMWKERVILEHHANAAFVRRDVVDAHTVQFDLAMGGGFKPCKHHQTGRFARPRRS